MRGIRKYVAVALIAAALGAFASSKWADRREPTVVIKHDTIIKTITDSTPVVHTDTVTVKAEPVIIKVPVIEHDTVVVNTEVETTQYTGTDTLENGTIEWTIYADKLHARKFKLTTEKEQVITTIEKTLPAKSRLYATGGVDLGYFDKSPQAAEVGLFYNRRQKWGVGVAIRKDFSGLLPVDKTTTVGIKVHIGL